MGIDKNMARTDAFDRVTGSARYIADLESQGPLVTKVIHSTIANDVIKSFDLEEVRKMSGVVRIATCFDVPDIQFPAPDHPWSVETAHQDITDRKLLNTRMRVYGDDIAAVTAENDTAAARTARLVRVEYERYAPLLTAGDAMAEGASRFRDEKPGSVIAHSFFVVGEGTYEEAVKEEGLVEIEKSYRTQSVQHCHIKTPISFAYVEKGRVIVTTSTQIPHIVRRVINQTLGLPMDRIHVIKPYIGGGFGNKQDVFYGPLNASLTTQVGGRRARMEMSREETLGYIRVRYTTELEVKTAARKDDTLITRKLEACSNQGGYASHTRAIVANSPNEFKQIYKDEKVLESDAWIVHTNLTTGGAMRGCRIPQAAFATECIAGDLALALHMGPLEFREKSCMRPECVGPHTHVKYNTYDLAECMEKGREFIHWNEKRGEYEDQTGPVRKGIGMAIFCYKTGVYPISLETAPCRMILNQDDSMQLQMRVAEIGQGADTMFTQMATEVTGIMGDKVNVLSTQDTDISPFDTGAYASRQTYVSDMAMEKTDAVFREKILDYAAYMLEEPQGTLDVRGNHIVNKGTGTQLLPMEEPATTAFYSLDRSIYITAETTSHYKTNTFATDACFAEVEVDVSLSKMKVINIVDIHDNGELINSRLAATQVHGGMSMRLGYGLNEELLFDAKGRPLNDNSLDHKLPTTMDTPDLNALFVESDNPTGPFGNKALGGPPAIPVAPAVRSAVPSAAGVTVDSLPMDPQKMVKHFKEAGLI